MKKASQIMNEMGFNPKSSDSAKEAFIKYLIKQSTGVNVLTPSEKKVIQENPDKIVSFSNQQMSFEFDEVFETPRKKA